MRILTISFDDGFRASCLKTAEIYERYGLRAEFNVTATAYERNRNGEDSPYGDFGLWNELAHRGHAVQPHGYDHSDKTRIPIEEAKEKISLCLDVFRKNLAGFEPGSSIFAFPFNASNARIEEWLGGLVRGFRTAGPLFNDFPDRSTRRLTTQSLEDAERVLEESVRLLLDKPEGWLLYTAHGLDGEGWAPIRSYFLERLLDALLSRGDVNIMNCLQVIRAFERE